MINLVIQYFLRFILLIFVQILVLNNIQLYGLINPYIYIMFIITLPFETPKLLVLTLGFILGIIIDTFSNTLGMHAAATVLIAFSRPYILKVLSPRDGYEAGTFPSVKNFGLSWFLRYTIIITLIHHFLLFYIEMFRLSDFFITFARVIISSIFTILLIILSQYLFKKTK